MTRMTITEALAEIKTIGKRTATNWEFVSARVARPSQIVDPLLDKGGTAEVLRQLRQSSGDLRARVVKIRGAIAKANQETSLSIDGTTRTLADWIIWRREVMPQTKVELDELAKAINNIRTQARQRGGNLKEQPTEPTDTVLHISETELAADRDHLEKVLGVLDGQLSLKNATTFIEVAD